MQKLKSKVFEKFQIENNMKSIKALPRNPVFQSVVAASITVGLLSWLHIRPLGLLFFTVFCFWFFKSYCSIRIKTPPELQTCLRTLQQRIFDFRKRRPTMFFLAATVFFMILAMLGTVVGCVFVLLSALSSGVLISTEFYFSNGDRRETINGIIFEELVDEFLPEEFSLETNATNMYVLERASDVSSATFPTDDGDDEEDRSDEVPSELLIPDSIPEIDENSTDDEQDDLLPTIELPTSHNRQTNSNPTTDALATSSPANESIEFKKGHFKRDSSLSTSSSSEESLSKGLQFPDHTAVDGPRKSDSSAAGSQQMANDLVATVVSSQTQALIANSHKLIPSLMSGLVQGVFGMAASASPAQSGPSSDPPNRRVVTALDSSDDSDFEILEREDFQ